jgi:energy-coupling factor transporter ATP-binding protein EcfA2
MILRSLSIAGFGCFADRIAIGPFQPGLNIVFGPNGTGKSTLSRAVTTALLDGHRVKAAEMKTLRSWGRRLTPQIAVEFEHDRRSYRIEKQFLDNPAASLFRQEGEAWRSFMSGDDADQFTRDILRCAPPASGVAQRDKHWGIAQILWTTQGTLQLPPLASSVVESVQRSVGAQLTAGGTRLEQRILDKYSEFYTPAKGQLRKSSQAIVLSEERERLEKERSTIEQTLAEFEMECARVEELKTKLATEEAEFSSRTEELKATRLTAQRHTELSIEHAQRLPKVKAAESEYLRISELIAAVKRCREKLSADAIVLNDLETRVPVAEVALQTQVQAVADLEAVFEKAEATETAAAECIRIAHLAREYVGAIQRAKDLGERIQAIQASASEVEGITRQRAELAAPSDLELRQFRDELSRNRDAQRRLELARIEVTAEPSSDTSIEIVEGEEPGRLNLRSGTAAVFAGAPNLTLMIPGFGTLRISGPVSDYASVRQDRDDSAARISKICERFGVADEKGLEALHALGAGLDASLREAKSTYAALCGNATAEAMEQERSGISVRVSVIQQEHPNWSSAVPDGVALLAAAEVQRVNTQAARVDACRKLMAAQQKLKEAGAVCQTITQQQQTLEGSMKSARTDLEVLCGNVSDDQRQAALLAAAMERMGHQEGLQQIEKQLASYPADPAALAAKQELALEAARRQLQLCRDARRDAERRVSQLAEQAPYSRFAELSERLDTVEEQCRREEMRMGAVALLRSTLLERKGIILESVSKPVEDRATSYLARICGKPLASIRMTRDFAAETVMPADMGHSEEPVSLERMSGGEKEQIHLCTRLALAEELMREQPHFLLLDDVLTATDSTRLRRVCDMLSEFSRHTQVILFTCHPERFACISEANLIDMEAVGRSYEPGHHRETGMRS